MAIVFKIDNVDKSNLINFDSLKVKDNLYSEVNECYFIYEKYGSRIYVPAGGDEIGVWDGAVKIFGGKITDVMVKVKGKVLVYEVGCKDWVDQLDAKLVVETYASKTVNQIITDIQSKYAVSFDITNVNCTTNIEAVEFARIPVSKCIDELAKIAGYHWYVDPDKKIYFFAEGSIISPFDVTDTNGKCLTQSLEIENDYEQIKNRINITGGEVDNIQVYNQLSIDTYGEHEIVIKDDSLTSIAEATQKANAMLVAYKDPIKKGEFATYDAGLVSGQKINVNSALRGVNQDFIIESVGFKARTPTDFIYEVRLMTQQDNPKGLIGLLEKGIMAPLPDVKETYFGDRRFSCSIKFSIVNYHKISWAEGKIIMSSGEDYTIAADSREFTNTEICYFKPSTSETELQFSTTFGDGMGEDRVALGYAVPNPNIAKGAQFIPVGFMGGIRFWGGENIVARTIIANQIGLKALTSELVTAGEFITSSAQIKNAIITDLKISGKITVGHTDADVTNDNPQSYSWITGAKPPIDADKTQDELDLGASIDNAKANGFTFIQGGYIATDVLTADNIVTGILTGRTVRTSDGTNRIELNGADEKIYFFKAGIKRLAIWEDRIRIYDSAENLAATIYGDTNQIIFAIGGGGYTFQNDIFASLGSTDLGSSLQAFKDLYLAGNIYLDGNITAPTQIRFVLTGGTKNVSSDGDEDTYLGLSNHQWKEVFARKISGNFGGNVIDLGSPDAIVTNQTYLPSTDSAINLGADTLRWLNCYADNFPASPIRVTKNAVEVFKNIKKIDQQKGDYFLQTKDLPKEFKITDKDGKEHTELKRTVGLNTQAIMELIKKVEALE